MINKIIILSYLEKMKIFQELSYSIIDLPNNFPDVAAFACENKTIDRRFYLNYAETEVNSIKIQKFGGLNISRFNFFYPDIYFEKYFSDADYSRKMDLNYYVGTKIEKLSCFFSYLETLLKDPFIKKILEGKTWSSEYHKHLYESINR